MQRRVDKIQCSAPIGAALGAGIERGLQLRVEETQCRAPIGVALRAGMERVFPVKGVRAYRSAPIGVALGAGMEAKGLISPPLLSFLDQPPFRQGAHVSHIEQAARVVPNLGSLG